MSGVLGDDITALAVVAPHLLAIVARSNSMTPTCKQTPTSTPIVYQGRSMRAAAAPLRANQPLQRGVSHASRPCELPYTSVSVSRVCMAGETGKAYNAD